MEKRYQVFVSSTYEDLREERQEVMQALLELDCIPSGMELFPAASEDQWTIIKNVIHDCDYYVVVVGGRYGSIGSEGKSYTQMEYEYALSLGKPVVAFLREHPEEISVAKTEVTDGGKEALESFRALVRQKTVRTYKSASDLGSVVSRSRVKLIKTHPAVGWIRADESAGGVYAQEILQLRKQNEQLKIQLEESGLFAPPGSKRLAQGNEFYFVEFFLSFCEAGVPFTWGQQVKAQWADLSKLILPLARPEATESTIAAAVEVKYYDDVLKKVKRTQKKLSQFKVKLEEHCLRTILVQHQALGFLSPIYQAGDRARWKLTPTERGR